MEYKQLYLDAYEVGKKYIGKSMSVRDYVHTEEICNIMDGSVYSVAFMFFMAGRCEGELPYWVKGWRYGEIREGHSYWSRTPEKKKLEYGASMMEVTLPDDKKLKSDKFKSDLPKVEYEGWLNTFDRGNNNEPLIWIEGRSRKDVVEKTEDLDLADQEARNKAQVIYDLLNGIARKRLYYWHDGALHFDLKTPNIFPSLDCLVIPANDKYKIKITTPINIATKLILYEVENIDSEKLYDTMVEIIKYLDNEWVEWNKDKKYKGWSGYPKAKVIKYDDHGYIISVS